jgi:hypothetical protein
MYPRLTPLQQEAIRRWLGLLSGQAGGMSFQEREIRRSQQHEAVYWAYQGKKSQLCDLLREDGWWEVADLIERAKLPRRGKPELPGSFADVVQEVVATARSKRQAFGYGERNKWLKGVMTLRAAFGLLSKLSDDEKERLPQAIEDKLKTQTPERRRQKRKQR